MGIPSGLRAFLFVLGLITLLALGGPARADIIFSNLVQPGDQFGPDAVSIGAIPVPGIFLYVATNFTVPGLNYRLSQLELPLAIFSGPSEVDVFLLSDSGDLPDGPIESFHLLNVPSSLSLLTIGSTLHPVLSSGTQYWVAATGGTPTTHALWGLTVFTGDPIAGGAQRVIDGGVDLGWTRNPGTRVGALRVSGVAVPEPTSILLFGSGLAGLVIARVTKGRPSERWKAHNKPPAAGVDRA